MHLVPILLFWIASVVYGQKGFINISCGTHEDFSQHYGDFLYTSDAPYIDTGESRTISSSIEFVYSAEYDFLKTLRSFPNSARNCNTIKPVTQGSTYLVRGYFMYGNYDALNIIPKFDLYLGTNYWDTITFTNASSALFAEIMVVAPANYLSVCLVNTNSGKPVISALELRSLSSSMYSEVTTSQLLVYRERVSFGVDDNLRYPEDQYDRIWESHNTSGWRTLSTESQVVIDNVYKTPLQVMQTAASPIDSSTLDFVYRSNILGSQFHFLMHFAELQPPRENQSRIFSITVNDVEYYRSFKPNILSISTIHNNTTPRDQDELLFSLNMSSHSTLPPLINALELYFVRQVEYATSKNDVDAMKAIKSIYNVKKNWMGDSCLPLDFIWNGLICRNESSKTTRIISLDLSSSGLTGEITSSFAKLNKLMHLDLSTNNLTGGIPEFLGSLEELNYLNLNGSGVSGPVPKSLLDRSKAGLLNLVYVDDKSMVQDPDNKRNVIIIATSVSSAVLLSSLVALLIFIFRRKPSKQESETETTATSVPSQSVNSEQKKFKHTELVCITSNFEKKIGEGGFGKVYYGVLENGLPVAVKVLSNESTQGSREFQTEAQVLSRIHHKNLVYLVGYCIDTKLALVYEYMEKGSLADYLSGKDGIGDVLCLKLRLSIAKDVAQGLYYLHEGCTKPIVHRDIKTSNILLNKNYEAKISDFGLSRTCNYDSFTQTSTAFMGTLGYIDNACFGLSKPSEKSDVYAFGIVILEILTSRPAIIKKLPNYIHIVDWVRSRFERGRVDDIVDPNLQVQDMNSVWKTLETALSCVAEDPVNRPTMRKIVVVLDECLKLEAGETDESNVSMSTDWEKSFEVLSIEPSLARGPSQR